MNNNASKELKKEYYINNYDSLCEALTAFNAVAIEKEPLDEKELYLYYTYVDKLIVWLKNAYKDNLYVLCNEIRAVLGHLSEYIIQLMIVSKILIRHMGILEDAV